MTGMEAAQLFATLQAAWNGRVAENDVATELWLRRLKATEFVTAQAAVVQLIEHSEFPPTIAALVNAIWSVMRYPAVGETRKELGYAPEPMSVNVAKRINDEFKRFKADREQRRKSMTADEFIRSEGHDPETHWLNKSGFVLRKVHGRKYE